MAETYKSTSPIPLSYSWDEVPPKFDKKKWANLIGLLPKKNKTMEAPQKRSFYFEV
jgi:hypothetical protein